MKTLTKDLSFSVLGLRHSRRGGLPAFALPLGAVVLLFPSLGLADLPPGTGRTLMVQLCSRCHGPEIAAAQHQTERQWEQTISKMVGYGAQGTDEQFETIVGYLTKNFGPVPLHPLNINDATAVELEAALDLTRPESRLVVQYRTDHGPFKSIDDLRNIQGLDFRKVEARKTRVSFGSN